MCYVSRLLNYDENDLLSVFCLYTAYFFYIWQRIYGLIVHISA